MLKVCIVEDEPDNIKLLEEYLLRFGEENGVVFRIDKFADGLSFLDAYRPVYDLVFMDIRMQGFWEGGFLLPVRQGISRRRCLASAVLNRGR